MQYLVYFAVATPLVLGWLMWASATIPPQAPLFSQTGLDAIAAAAPAAEPGPVINAVAERGHGTSDKARDKNG